jgi:hypothetical protein
MLGNIIAEMAALAYGSDPEDTMKELRVINNRYRSQIEASDKGTEMLAVRADDLVQILTAGMALAIYADIVNKQREDEEAVTEDAGQYADTETEAEEQRPTSDDTDQLPPDLRAMVDKLRADGAEVLVKRVGN